MIEDDVSVFFVAFVVSVVLSPVMRWMAVRNGIIDLPDRGRKSHVEPVAYLGGVAIFVAWLSGLASTGLLSWGSFGQGGNGESIGFPLPLIVGATVIVVTGLIDDVYGITPRVKIGGQFMAAAALAWSSQNLGTKLVTDLFAAGGLTVPFTLAYVLGAVVVAMFVLVGCNSMNLLDGLDGLAGGGVGDCVSWFFVHLDLPRYVGSGCRAEPGRCGDVFGDCGGFAGIFTVQL